MDSRRATSIAVAVAALVTVAGLAWAKWVPYVGKAFDAARTHQWSGRDVLTVGGVEAGDAPTWHAAATFFGAYAGAIWPALLVALLISACVQAFLPRAWMPRLMNRRHRITSAATGGVAALPSMMCACCSAPVAVTLRRSGVDQAAAVAYWLSNPLLNPAVLVFLALVAPWQWTLTRLVVGIGAVVGGAALVAAISRRDRSPAEQDSISAPAPERVDAASGVVRFGKALFGLSIVLIPEYLVMVLAIGAGRGWLLTLIEPGNRGLLVVVIAAVAGTLMVIPTAGEIPILQGLALLGVSTGVLGALLITLPAVSLPGIAMVVRSFGWRTTFATAGMVVVAGLVGAALLSAL